jgi:hypothetical protein
MELPGGAVVQAHHLSVVVDVENGRPGCPGQPVDGNDPPVVTEVAVGGAVGREVVAHDLAAGVDAEGLYLPGPGDLDRGEPAALVAQETAERHSVGARAAGGRPVAAGDLAAIVDVQQLGGAGAGKSILVNRPFLSRRKSRRQVAAGSS